MKIADYSKVTSVSSGDLFLLNGSAGTKTILASSLANALPRLFTSEDALFAMLDAAAPPEMHREVYRGKNLGSSLTSTQQNNIANGTFKDLWLGDYWAIGGTNWVISDFDYWIKAGDNGMWGKHHLVLMPDYPLYQAKMNASATTEGGYTGSEMYTTNLMSAKQKITGAFGSAVLTHRENLTNAVTNGSPSGNAWYDSTVELPSETMVFGHFVSASDTSIAKISETVVSQLAVYAVTPFFNTGNNIWLRDIADAQCFASVYKSGSGGRNIATNSNGVCPVFAIG